MAVNPFATWMLGGIEVIEDSMCRTDTLRWIDKGVMKRVRYPGSTAFIPGMVEGIFWPRLAGGLWVSESDAMYQDSVNYYSRCRGRGARSTRWAYSRSSATNDNPPPPMRPGAIRAHSFGVPHDPA